MNYRTVLCGKRVYLVKKFKCHAGQGTSWASVLLSDESQITVCRNDGHQRCYRHWREFYASATTDTRFIFGFGGATVWTVVSSQHRTALHFVNGTVTSMCYLKSVISPVIVPLHEQRRSNFCSLATNATICQSCIIRE